MINFLIPALLIESLTASEQSQEQLLASYCQRERASIVFVMPEKCPIRKFPSTPMGMYGLEVLASSSQCQIKAVSGHYVLMPDLSPIRTELDREKTIGWLQKMRSEDLYRMKSEGISLNDLDSELRTGILRMANMPPGGWDKAIAGNSPQKLFLSVTFGANVTDLNGSKICETWVDGRTPKKTVDSYSQNANSSQIMGPINNLREGSIDYGQGKIIELEEFVKRAGALNQKAIKIDPRLLNSKVFVSGAFNPQDLLEIVEAVADPGIGISVIENPGKTDIASSLMERLGKDGIESDVAYVFGDEFESDVFGKYYRADQFKFLKTETPGMPLTGKELSQYQVRFSPEFRLVWDFGGLNEKGIRQFLYAPVLKIK